MKKLLSLILSFAVASIMMMASVSGVWAANYPRLVDNAGLLNSSEAEEVLSELDEFSEEHQFDLVVVTVNDGLEDPELEAYADDFYDNNGYGFGEDHDGALLLVDMNSRMMHVSTTGYGITVLTDYGIDKLTDDIASYLGNEEYEDAFTDGFIDNVEWMYERAAAGDPYDYDDDSQAPNKGMVALVIIVVAIIFGLILAKVATDAKKKELISVRMARGAASYLRKGSLNLTKNSDMFLYSNLVVNVLPDDDEKGGSSTHMGSSGTFHGGGSKGF